MEQFVINIGRQLGSGGRTVGEIIARRLGVKLYDKELINLAARESGICPEFFEKADEKESRGVICARIRAASMSSSRPTMPTASAASAAGRDAPRRRPAR